MSTDATARITTTTAMPTSSDRGRHRWAQVATRAVASLAVVALAIVVPTSPAAATTISGLEPIQYTEGDGPVPVAPNAVITESGSFADGYVEFAVENATATETLSLPSVATPDTTLDAVSAVGSAVFLGLGGDAKQIGTIDPVRNGIAGQPLRINFSAVLPNADFAGPVAGSGAAQTPDGWTVNRNAVPLGATADKSQGRPVSTTGSGPYTVSGPGYSFQTDFNYGTLSSSQWGYESKQRGVSGTFSSEVTSYAGNGRALRLFFNGNCPSPNDTSFCSAFGPEALSAPFEAKAGDDLAFDWAAANGSDHYEVYGFIVNQDTGVSTQLMYGRGALQGWTTTADTIPADGTYRFRFVAGSYDKTGGYAIGASLYIDNVRVLSSDADAAVAQSVTRLVQYENTSDDPPAERTISVETATAGGTPTTETVPTEVQPVDDPPTIAPIATTTFTNTIAADDFATATGTLPGSDPESDPITYGIDGGEPRATTIGATDYDVAIDGTYGTLHVASATGEWAFVPDGPAIDAQLVDTGESFTVTAASNGLEGDATLGVAVSVPASAPGAPTISEAGGGDAVVDLEVVAPAWLGGSPISGYRVETSTGSGWSTAIADTGSGATSIRVSGLTNGVTYGFRVSAINATGTSPASAEATATPRTVPAAPIDLGVTPGDRSLALGWDVPITDGGSPITGYRIETSDDGGASWSTAVADTGSADTTAELSGLSNGRATQVRVAALNALGAGAVSDVASATPRTVPGAPRNVRSTPGDGWAVLTWDEPASDGGAKISGYRIETSDDGGLTWTELVADTADTGTRRLIGGLSNGEPLTVRVQALNEAGLGAESTPATSTPRTVPGAPDITGVTPGNRQVTVAFTAPPDDGGAPISNYEYSVDGGRTWTSASPATTRGPITIHRLANGDAVRVQLRAVNAAGAGAADSAGPITPRAQPVTPGRSTAPPVPRGGAELLIDGTRQPAELVDTSTEPDDDDPMGTIEVRGGGVTIGLTGLDADGDELDLDDEGRLQMVPGETVRVSGEGYRPGSTVDVWLVPGDVLLGTVTVGPDGTFEAELDVPEGLDVGTYVLQLNGVGADGASRTVSVEAVAVAGATQSAAPVATPVGTPVPLALAFTGTDPAALLLAGLALVLVGLAARRRGTDGHRVRVGR